MTALLLLICLVVGILMGAVGVGGVLLIPALYSPLAGLGIKQAMATALLTFIFAGIVGTLSYLRRGNIPWSITVPVCLGAIPFGFLGAWVNSMADVGSLRLLLAAFVAFTGLHALLMRASERDPPFRQRPRLQWALLLGVGAAVGFGSGLTGVGGPALSVPIMVLLGFAPLAAIGASQVVQVLSAASGTIGNLQYGSIDFTLAGPIIIAEGVGVLLGVRIAHRVDATVLRALIGIACVLVGLVLL